eukprot:GHUV01013535.1.p1 GENE.GHUV01013535.1~~GHUV01013535.1.p1  ORF type:complete len:390 (+),score=74.65 GHUV01013535.1:224-1393(+)
MQQHQYSVRLLLSGLLLCTVSVALVIGATTSSSRDSRPLRFIMAPITGNSPAMDLMGVAAQLKERGHEVLVVCVPDALDFMKSAAARHSSNTTAGALQYITLDMGIAAREQQQQQQAETDTQRHKQRQQHAVTKERFAEPTSIIRRMTVAMDLLLVIQDILAEPCSRIITEQTVFKRLLAFQADAIMAIGLSISGGSASDSCGCLLSHALGVTLIDVEGGGLWTGPPSVPQFGTGLTPADLKSWHGYTLNLVTWTLRQSMPLISHFWGPGSWKRVRDRLGLPRASSDSPLADALERVRGTKVRKCEALMGVILGSWLLEYPRALAAHQVIVGPGTPRTPHPITSPTDVADFANTAYDGLILVAFGTSYQVGGSPTNSAQASSLTGSTGA